MRMFIFAVTALALSTGGAEARHHHFRHQAAAQHTWNWSTPGFWEPRPVIYIVRHRPAVAHHARVRIARHHTARIAKASPVATPVAGNGVVKAASGAVAYVAKSATAAFQCVVTALEAAGYPIKEMGGFASRGHIRHSLHYSGLALDINQIERNVTRPRMPANEIEIARGCGLTSGASWGYADSGHFEIPQHYASRPRHRHYARHYRSNRRIALYRHERFSFMQVGR